MKKAENLSSKSWDPNWDEVFSNQEWGKYPSENLIQFIARNFYKRNREEIKILEVGCGTGANLWYISREGFQAFGIDGSEIAIARARERMISENLIVDLQIGDIVNLPFVDGFFDVVIDNECIYSNNYDNSDLILKEIARVLKTNGKFYSRTFSEKMFIGEMLNESDSLEYKGIIEGPLKGKGFVRLSSKESIKKLYGKYFVIKSIDYLQYTMMNEAITIDEWVVICDK